ncbi:MAG TPA: biopolymer transporter ExbD [Prolixibacteraceae bacterium]|nr:biopolymer transporter ExbD [Prolixibacteraceae bacterium]
MRKTPEVPGASLADIAFMLLIFFLVATTMDVDSGLERRLSPMPPVDQEDPPPIKERNVFTVLLDANNRLMVEGELIPIDNLRDKAKEFMLNSSDNENLPEKKMTEIPLIGNFPVTKGIISLRNDQGTQYGMYIKVQNELVAAINELRDEMASAQFGKTYATCNAEQKEAVGDAVPLRISEAEPKMTGGTK